MRESGENLGDKPKRAGNGVTAATITRAIATSGEIFSDGSTIELIGGDERGKPLLLLWDGVNETIGSSIEHGGVNYEPTQFDASLLRAWTLPAQCRPHGTTRELLTEICELARNFAGLSAVSASLVGRFVLCSWLVEAFQVAPALLLVGQDAVRGMQLATLLHCLCRHGLRMTGLTAAGLRSLPSGAKFTLILCQRTINNKLESLLDDASHRDQKIPYRGCLLDLFGAQIIIAESISLGEPLSLRSIQVPLIPGGAQLPVLDPDVQQRITFDFQARLLNFRRANLSGARKFRFDSSQIIFRLRDLAQSFAAATPDDAGLQAEVFDLLREKDEEIRSGIWIELSAVAVESILVACQESSGGSIYVGELALFAQETLSRRGEQRAIDIGTFGKRLKVLGFRTEPRDAKGMRIRLTEEVCRRARQLARDLGVPRLEDVAPTETPEPIT